MGEAGRRQAVRYDWETVVLQVLDVYGRALAA
jgi:hypothetical protein